MTHDEAQQPMPGLRPIVQRDGHDYLLPGGSGASKASGGGARHRVPAESRGWNGGTWGRHARIIVAGAEFVTPTGYSHLLRRKILNSAKQEIIMTSSVAG